MSLRFGRKISYLPFLVCLFAGVVIGFCLYFLSGNVVIGILFGILGFIVGAYIYSINLSSYYGYWEVDNDGVHYYDYGTTSKRVRAILLPTFAKKMIMQFDDIKSSALVVGKGIQAPKGTFGGVNYAPDVVLSRFPTAYFLTITLSNGQEVDLDLAEQSNSKADIQEMVKVFNEKTGSKVKFLEQKA
ncbi:hypothetical protein [Companilactobacillus kimchiensis]|uniref:Uncharacterized protein n=1 Tax=Companilactobacillus kimchiensis TaxID=993692 RepID=A0A0R2LDT1_9LACO|nr:hypothetical protein [Companilactobacillus kimchiensis]KRO00030.1 hypothetical protein IV57_GL002045 [Companilactobacillus kimchiensis]